VALAFDTLISEDAALAGAALMARAGVVTPLAAVVAVALGIWIGDLALFLAGRLAGRWPPLARYVDRRWPRSELRSVAARLEQRAGWAIFASRALPGSRVPLYVAAGLFRLRLRVFAVCTAAASTVWTAAIVLGAVWLP
jgi:membrane protein DedA with SNARE-associated domain